MGTMQGEAVASNVYIEANLDSLIENLQTIKNHLGAVQLMFVVKGNAYGMGYGPAARAAELSGAVELLGVTHPYEGDLVRKAGVKLPIFVMGTTLPDEAEALVERGYVLSVSEPAMALALQDAAEKAGKTVAVHIAVDTGMGRYGVKEDGIETLFEALRNAKNLQVTGIFSHLAAATDKQTTAAQKAVFDRVAGQAEGAFGPLCKHILNSEGTVLYPDSRHQMVRVGNLAYGMNPFRIKLPFEMKNTFEARGRIVRIFNLKKGESVGYGRRFVAKRDMTCALIPAGNADGYLLKPVTSHYTLKTALKDVAGTLLKWTGRRPDVVEVNGQKCPILDASPVQQTVIDVTGKTVSLGDSVRLGIRRPIAGAMIPHNYVYLGQTYAGEEALLSALNFEK